jgi:acetate kinase
MAAFAARALHTNGARSNLVPAVSVSVAFVAHGASGRIQALAMNDYALVLNAGSSSLKFCVYRRSSGDTWALDARGRIDGVGTTPRLRVEPAAGAPTETALAATTSDGRAAVEHVADWLRARYAGGRFIGVGHRVVHGGATYTAACLATPEVLADLRALIPLAPLHQPDNLAAIEVMSERMPGVPQVACFDTSFHRDHAAVAQLVPLPRGIRDTGVRRYGFHGLSYEYIASVLPTVAPDVADGRVIVAHLGSGASLCALHGRKSVETTLGLTALDGLCMSTRPGSLDPGIVLHLIRTLGLSAADVEAMLYEQSGLLGISGISGDMRVLVDHPEPAARLAVDYFVYQAAKHVGALAAVLGGVEALVFTAGVGEHSAEIRARICAASAWLGVTLDAGANAEHAARISTAGSRVSAWVIPTDEESMIARHMGAMLGLGAIG